MQAVVLPPAMGAVVPTRGTGSGTDAKTTFDGLVGEAEAMEVSGGLPDRLSEADPEELETSAQPSDAEDGDLAEHDVPDLCDLPVTTEDVPVPTEAVEPTEFALQLGEQDPMTDFESSEDLLADGGETTPIPATLAGPVGGAVPGIVPLKVGDDVMATNEMPQENAKNTVVIDAPKVPSELTAVKSEPGKIGQAPVAPSQDLPVQMENGVEVGRVMTESGKAPIDSDAGLVLSTSTVGGSPSGTAVDPVKGGMPANMHAAPSDSAMVSEASAPVVADGANADPTAALPKAILTAPGTITAKQTEGGVPISIEGVENDAPLVEPEVPAATDATKNMTPFGPLKTDEALPKTQLPEVLAVSSDAKDQQFELNIEQSPRSAVAEADLKTAAIASDRPTDLVKPRSAIVPNVVERVAALPREVGETVIHLKPHGMGLIEVSIQQARDGGLDIVLRIQNPMVLEAMQADRQAVAQAIGGQGGAASGSLTMDLFQSGGGQRGAQGDNSGATSRTDTLPTTEELLDNVTGQASSHQIIQSDHVNIIT